MLYRSKLRQPVSIMLLSSRERTSLQGQIMTSEARAAANTDNCSAQPQRSYRTAICAANAQHSTGPRTEAGKARSSRNAVSHGLCSQQNFIMPGEESIFASMHDTLLDQLAPADGVEMMQFEVALHASWGMRRCRLIENALFEKSGPEALLDPQLTKSFACLQRYEAHHQRSFDRALRTLRTLQAERLARRAAAGCQDPVPVHVPVAEIDKRTRQITKRTHSLVLIAGSATSSDAPSSPELQNEPNAAILLRREVA
jgi:hypothetical protein